MHIWWGSKGASSSWSSERDLKCFSFLAVFWFPWTVSPVIGSYHVSWLSYFLLLSCLGLYSCLLFLILLMSNLFLFWTRRWNCNCNTWEVDWYVGFASYKLAKGYISCVGWGRSDVRYGFWASDSKACFSGLNCALLFETYVMIITVLLSLLQK